MSDQKRRGRLFVLAGPSGAGKGTLRARIIGDIENLVYSISCTTRSPRPGERNGVEYRFISKQEFEDRIKQGLFLEHAFVHDHCYGTLREDVERELGMGHDVLLEIDVQGAEQIRTLMPDSVLIFVSPPSPAVLEERLRQRDTESDEQIALRLENAKKEMQQAPSYEHNIVNDTVERAAGELKGIILGHR